jgi:hypothetical protein
MSGSPFSGGVVPSSVDGAAEVANASGVCNANASAPQAVMSHLVTIDELQVEAG